MTINFKYLTPKMSRKLKRLVKEWKENGEIPIKDGPLDIVMSSPMSKTKSPIFSLQELMFLKDNGFIDFILNEGVCKNMSGQWAIVLEPTYLGTHYPRVALINLLLEVEWIIPLSITIWGFIKSLN